MMSPQYWLVSILLLAVLLAAVLPATAQVDDCPGVPPSVIEANGVGVAVGAAQALYAEPSASAAVVGKVPVGGLVNVLRQTACAGVTRWRQVVYNGTVGYVAEFVGGAAAFEPYTPPEPVDVNVLGRRTSRIVSDLLTGEHSNALAMGFVMQPRPGYTYPRAISPYPNYTLYTVDGYYIVQDHARTPNIGIYPIDEWRLIGGYTVEMIDRLQALLTECPPLPLLDEDGARAEMIDLPARGAAQLVAASQRYIDFENGAGVRFISYYAQLSGEIGQGFVYTFNGITDDGRYYISADFPILLPEGTLPAYDAEADLAAGEEPMNSYYIQYLAQVTAAVEALEDYQTTPGLQTLDAMFASFYVGERED